MINEYLDHDKVPAEIAVFVEQIKDGVYQVVISADGQHYLMEGDLPGISVIGILVPTY